MFLLQGRMLPLISSNICVIGKVVGEGRLSCDLRSVVCLWQGKVIQKFQYCFVAGCCVQTDMEKHILGNIFCLSHVDMLVCIYRHSDAGVKHFSHSFLNSPALWLSSSVMTILTVIWKVSFFYWLNWEMSAIGSIMSFLFGFVWLGQYCG